MVEKLLQVVLIKINLNSYDDLVDKYNNDLVSKDLINYIISLATKQSIYAYNNQIKNCYITTDSGIRIGLCGTVVYDNDEVSTIKNITSRQWSLPSISVWILLPMNCFDKTLM